MEKIRCISLLFFLIFIISQTNAQNPDIIKKGLIRTQLTISPSYMFSDKQSYFYLHGNIEGYVSSKISIAGEAYYNLGSLSSQNNSFEYNHSVFFGASRHFNLNKNDIYIGLQPGLSFTKLSGEENNLTRVKIGVNPLISPIVGYNFYMSKLFHLFIQTRLVFGEHNYDRHKELTEFRFSAGLGFNINTK